MQNDPFLWFNGEFVQIDLDNPLHDIPAQTD